MISGSRLALSGEIDYTGERGYYWSSTVAPDESESGGYRLIFTSNVANVGPNSNYRAGGLSIRCIKN